MRRATDKTYPQNTSQIAMYAAARKFKFFIPFLPEPSCSLTLTGGTGFSLWVFAC